MAQVLGSVAARRLGFLCPRSPGPGGASFSPEWPPASCLALLLAVPAWARLIPAAERPAGTRPPATVRWVRAGGCLCVVSGPSGPREAPADCPCLWP